MSYTFIYHPLVQEDYNEAYEWYESKQKGLGEKFFKAVRQKIDEINLRPAVYGSRQNKMFREASVDFFPFIITYKINEVKKEIYISSIHHNKKHPQKKYRRKL